MTDPLDAREVRALVARMSPPELALWRELGGDLTREQRRRVREWRRGECVRIQKEIETRKAVERWRETRITVQRATARPERRAARSA